MLSIVEGVISGTLKGSILGPALPMVYVIVLREGIRLYVTMFVDEKINSRN